MITYDYPAIEECVSLMSSKASEILSQIETMRGQVKTIMQDWSGSTADSYNKIADDLVKDLTQNHDNLGQLKNGLMRAAESMQQQDRSGGKAISAW